MTWEENRRKGEKERSRITTSVCMFDLSGKHIKDFESIKEAVKETGLNQSGITSCCCGRYKQTGGYVFRYKYSCYKKQNKQSEISTTISWRLLKMGTKGFQTAERRWRQWLNT